MSDEQYLTVEGLEKLKQELDHLKGPEREEIAKRLNFAVSQGDLSENADYTKAKEDQSFLEGRIQELEYLVKNALIIDEDHNGRREEVEVGATITIQEDDYPSEVYFMVGTKEADPQNGKISNESPIGTALLGAKVGDIVEVNTPGGKIKFKVLKIE